MWNSNFSKFWSLIIFCFLFLNGCSFFGGYDELTLKRKDYEGELLNFNGYYIHDDGLEDNVSIFFLYRNGIILYVMTLNKNEVPYLEKRIVDMDYSSHDLKRYHWGVFSIDGNKISFEKWAAYDGYKPAFLHSGKILNDTIFVITSVSSDSKLFESPKYSETHKLYHFRPLIRKPDSINEFIK